MNTSTLKSWLLVSCLMTTPVLAREVQTLSTPVALMPSRYFLLKSDGENFKDTKGQPAPFLTQGPVTSKFAVNFFTRTANNVPRPSLGLIFTPMQKLHYLSLDRPQMVFLEVDGVQLPFIDAFDNFSYRTADTITDHLDLALQPLALKRITSAKKSFAIKVRLYSAPLGQSGECTGSAENSAKQRSCINSYTGAVFSGGELQKLQTLLKPFLKP